MSQLQHTIGNCASRKSIMTFANFFSRDATAEPCTTALELVCPVNSLVTLRTAVDHGADWIRLDHSMHDPAGGLADLNPASAIITRGIRYAHDKNRRVLLAIHSDMQPSSWGKLRDMIDCAARWGVDAIALSDPSLMLYAVAQHPHLGLHFEIQEASLDDGTINFFQQRVGVSRVLLSRILTLAQVARIAANTSVELQVTGFGKQSALVAGSKMPLPVEQHMDSRETNNTLDTDCANLCGTAEHAVNDSCFVLEKSPGTGALQLLPQLTTLGVRAIQVEALEYGSTHLAQVTRVWREAVDECLENLDHYAVKPSWIAGLRSATLDRRSS